MDFSKVRNELDRLDDCVTGSIRAVMMFIRITKEERPALYEALIEHFDDPYEIPEVISDDARRRYWKHAIRDVLGVKAWNVTVDDWNAPEVVVNKDEEYIEISQFVSASPEEDVDR